MMSAGTREMIERLQAAWIIARGLRHPRVDEIPKAWNAITIAVARDYSCASDMEAFAVAATLLASIEPDFAAKGYRWHFNRYAPANGAAPLEYHP